MHYFLAPNPGSAPVAGAEHLARYWRKVARMIDARWIVEHVPLAGTRPSSMDDALAARRSRRAGGHPGAEWFVFRDGLIAEIRDRRRLGAIDD